MNHQLNNSWLAIAIPALLIGCGTNEPTDTDPIDVSACFPMSVGDYWSYEETDAYGDTDVTMREVIEEKTMTFGNGLGDREVMVNLVTKPNSATKYRYYYVEDDGTVSQRVRQEFFNNAGEETVEREYVPPLLKFDRSKEVGDQWTVQLTAYDVDYANPDDSGAKLFEYTFEILSLTEEVEVPAGTFQCMSMKRTNNEGEAKTYYFTPGIGKVMEISAGGDTGSKTEELLDYSVSGG